MKSETKWIELGLFFKRKGSAVVVVKPETADIILSNFEDYLQSAKPKSVRFQCRREDSSDLAIVVVSLAEITYIGASVLTADKQ